MRQEIVYTEEGNGNLLIKNKDIRICIICGYDKVESHEFGISCEECGAQLGRSKC